jgi:molybdate transport system regulatory protein
MIVAKSGQKGVGGAASGSGGRLRARVWVESERNTAILTEAGADLLEQIEACGSLSEAARRLRYAYRRAWLLVDGMNKGWEAPLLEMATGGKRGGGTVLTEYGRAVLAAYRDVQLQVEHALDEAANGFQAGTRRKE